MAAFHIYPRAQVVLHGSAILLSHTLHDPGETFSSASARGYLAEGGTYTTFFGNSAWSYVKLGGDESNAPIEGGRAPIP